MALYTCIENRKLIENLFANKKKVSSFVAILYIFFFFSFTEFKGLKKSIYRTEKKKKSGRKYKDEVNI